VAVAQNGAGIYGWPAAANKTHVPANHAVPVFVPSTECPSGNPAVRAVRKQQKKEEKERI
jgi:hypothetical protein